MITLTYLPFFVRALFKGMPGVWKSRHLLILCWLILLQAVFPGRKTLKGLASHGPSHIKERFFRRLLKAGYWSVHILIQWFAEEAIKSFPPPQDGVLYVIGDSSEKDKRGKKNPAAQKGRKSKHHPWFFGIRFMALMASWDVYRIPAAFRAILPKNAPDYKKENVLFREMVQEFTPPDWAKQVIIEGDAAYASKDNMKMVKERNRSDSQRQWNFVFALARTWKTEEGKAIKDLVTYIPLKYFQKTWIPKLPKQRGRKTFWVYGKTLRLQHIGEVMVVLSKKGRNVGPKKTKIIVTDLAGVTLRQVISIYQRRWSVEILFKELKSALGLGQHQVTKESGRVEKSIGIALLAYLFLLRACGDEIRPGTSWSIFQLQDQLRLKVITNQVEHNMELKIKKLRKTA